MGAKAFQDQMPGNHCWGCGPANEHGLQLKSYWADDADHAVAHFQPHHFHLAGPEHILNGGIIATVLDCHAICTAIADAFKREGKQDITDEIWYVTGSLNIRYLKPAPVAKPVELRAEVTGVDGRKTFVTASLYADGVECARAEAVAIRVPGEWRE